MPFTKDYFKTLEEKVSAYLKRFPCSAVTVTIKANLEEYKVRSILSADDLLLTFCHYDEQQSAPFDEQGTQKTAYPALTVPYEVIESVEFDQATPYEDTQVQGFQAEGRSLP